MGGDKGLRGVQSRAEVGAAIGTGAGQGQGEGLLLYGTEDPVELEAKTECSLCSVQVSPGPELFTSTHAHCQAQSSVFEAGHWG